MLAFTARRQQENAVGMYPAFTGIKPNKERYFHGSNLQQHRILIPGAVHEITGDEPRLSGKTKSKNLKKGVGLTPADVK